VTEQVVRDTMAVYLDRRVIPEVLTLVLHPRRQVRVSGSEEMASRRGWTRLVCAWRVVELWTLPAESLLAMGDVGVVPWVPLAQSDRPPDVLLRECRERIDRQAPPDEHANLLAVAQVLARLRYNDPGILSIFGGRHAMIESPLIQELMAERVHNVILRFLTARFGSVPPEIEGAVRAVQDESSLDNLVEWAALCPRLRGVSPAVGFVSGGRATTVRSKCHHDRHGVAVDPGVDGPVSAQKHCGSTGGALRECASGHHNGTGSHPG
jgi:hypothetical protein